MTTVNFKSPEKYTAIVENGILKKCGGYIKEYTRGKRAFIVTDENVAPLYLETVSDSLESVGILTEHYLIPAGEQYKTTETVEKLIYKMVEADVTRSDFAVALGGGVITDLVGFCSAIYLRGIDYISIPTSLLAQLDASVGGKTGCDLPYGKNLVGAFYPPKAVLTDPETLATLPPREYASGLAEAVKCSMIRSEKLFLRLMTDDPHTFIYDIITECLKIKRDIVDKDAFDNGDRMLLNFGHTLGHSLEKYYGFHDITHGEAVGIGMMAVTLAAEKNGICEEGTAEKLAECLHRCRVPSTCSVDLKRLTDGAVTDKKCRGETINLIVPKRIGQCEILPLPKNELAAFFGE